MQFVVKRDSLLKSLNFVQGVVEKKNTLPILSNVLLQLKDKKLSIIATDLDIIFYDEITDVKIVNEGNTTTSAAILYDILRKIPSNSDLNFDLKSENKLSLKSENSDFNLLCLPTDNFPTFADETEGQEISLNNNRFLKLLNKTRISISNDDTRHYLNGVFLHLTEAHGRNFLTGVATDSHRLSSSSLEIESTSDFTALILPRKTVFQLSSLLTETSEKLTMQTSENKIKFTLGKIKLISKVIDGKFPDYKKVVPTTNDKIFSKQQAKIGASLYKNNCLICHDKKYFRPVFKAWDGQSLGTFYLVMSSSMPESNPGSLSQQEYVDILAYILSLNRYSSGEDVLLPSTEILNKITISARKK